MRNLGSNAFLLVPLRVFKVSGSSNLIMPKTKLQTMAQRAVEGDEQALDYLSLQESIVNWTTASTLTRETVCGNYNYSAHVLVVAMQLQLHVMRRTSRYALQSLTWIVGHHYKKELPPVATNCTVEDLVEMTAAIVDEVPPPHLNRAEDVTASSSSESESEEEPASKQNIKKRKKRRKRRHGGDPFQPRPHQMSHTRL